jgi:hypothetical protein
MATQQVPIDRERDERLDGHPHGIEYFGVERDA